MKRSLSFAETMAGNAWLDPDADRIRAMYFTVAVHAHHAFPLGTVTHGEIQGEVFIEGFANHRALRGTIEISPVFKKYIRYAFGFEADDGKKYRFEGQKDISFRRLLDTMTVLPGAILNEDGKPIGRAKLRFDMRNDIVSFLRSFRVVE